MKLRHAEGGHVSFWCPGCNESHGIKIPPAPNAWDFNGSDTAPTFSPSVHVRSGHFVSSHRDGDHCWCDYEARFGKPAPFACVVCHSFVRDGRIQFLGDCTHALKGQTVDLPEWPE